MIRFHILGAGGATPMPGYSPAAYFVRLDDEPVLMDPGPGALVRLVSAGLAPRGVDDVGSVLLTHLHPDHTLDLVALLFALHSPLPERTDPLRLWGPPGLEAWLEQLRGIWGRSLEPRLRPLEVLELAADETITLDGGATIAPFTVDHPQDRWARACYGYRFTDAGGGTVVFSGDTGPCPGLTAAARGADVLVVECSTTDDLATPGHMTPSEVGRLCAETLPGRVVLTHMYPPAAEADLAALVGAHTRVPVLKARDGTLVTVPVAEGDTP